MGFGTGDPCPEFPFRGDAGDLQPGDHVGGDRIGVLELPVEMPGQQQNRVFQFTLAVDEGALAELAGHHDGAEEDRRHQQAAAKRQPQHRPVDRGSKMPSAVDQAGLHDLQVVQQCAHFPRLSRGISIRRTDAISG